MNNDPKSDATNGSAAEGNAWGISQTQTNQRGPDEAADAPESRGRSWTTIGIAGGCVVVLLGGFVYLLMGGSKPTTTSPGKAPEDPIAGALDSLARETDLNTCRNALTQFNAKFAKDQKDLPPTLDDQSRERLRKMLDLTDDELAEIYGYQFTLLDAHHLDQSFLLRDVARSLPVSGRAPLDRAGAAFAWVVRQVRLQDGLFRPDQKALPKDRFVPALPPQFALRRGWGTPLDRALVFLALLNQMEEPGKVAGCLVCFPGKEGELPELWACGVAVEEEGKTNLYLFDPRLGLPLPGPNGKGVATLADVRKDPALLAQLTVKPENPYDVKPDKAKSAEIYEVCSLSALAPRMEYLQDKLRESQVRVNLVADPEAADKKLRAAAGGETPVPVKRYPNGHALMRMFLPKEEGGVDSMPPVQLAQIRGFGQPGAAARLPQKSVYEIELVPWSHLPEVFRNAEFAWNIGLGKWVLGKFADSFTRVAVEPKRGRDLMLRGRYQAAVEELSKERQEAADLMREGKKIEDDAKAHEAIKEWLGRALTPGGKEARAQREGNAALAAEARKELEALFKEEAAQLLETFLLYSAAKDRLEETTYWLALCKHEMAEQAQARLNGGARPGGGSPKSAEKDWSDALYWWEQCPAGAEGEAARRLNGEALAALGRRDEAIKMWESDPELPPRTPTHPLEKVACLYLAKREAGGGR
jgi:hypothetical protein